MQEVDRFHEILFLPLHVQSPKGVGLKEVRESLHSFRPDGSAVWEEVQDWFSRLDKSPTTIGLPAGASTAAAYAEFVYFHPFVRKLFDGVSPDEEDRKPPIRLFRRTGVEALDLRFTYFRNEKEWCCTVKLAVERVHLYLFFGPEGTIEYAILQLEVSSQLLSVTDTGPYREARRTAGTRGDSVNGSQTLTLPQVMEILDRMRRLYPPYHEFHGTNPDPVPKRVVDCLKWLDSQDKQLNSTDNCRDADAQITLVKDTRRPPLDLHWEWLLRPFEPYRPEGNAAITFEQLGDDRMPGMAYIGMPEPRHISSGDRIRIAFFDDPGDPNAFPNAPSFHDRFAADHCYDRFWHPRADGKHDWCGTRYLLCDYAFSVVGNARDSYFFANAQSGALAHFRYHYATMGLLLQYQKAALLGFYKQLATAVVKPNLQGKHLRTLQEEMGRIHTAFLGFTQQYWFEDFTNQMQGKEIHDLWRRHMKLPELYDQVGDAITRVNEYLDTRGEARLARNTLILTVVASVGLVLSLALSFFGMSGIAFGKDGVTGVSIEVVVTLVCASAIFFVTLLLLTFVLVRCAEMVMNWIEEPVASIRRAWRAFKERYLRG